MGYRSSVVAGVSYMDWFLISVLDACLVDAAVHTIQLSQFRVHQSKLTQCSRISNPEFINYIKGNYL